MQFPKLTEAQLRPIVEKWNALDCTMADAARKFKIPVTTLRDRLRAAQRLGMQVRGGPAAAEAARLGRSVDEFKKNFDKSYIVPAKIGAALEKLGPGWQYEVEFAKLAGVNLADLSHYRAQYEDHVVPLNRDGGKRVWAGTKALASKLREMVQ